MLIAHLIAPWIATTRETIGRRRTTLVPVIWAYKHAHRLSCRRNEGIRRWHINPRVLPGKRRCGNWQIAHVVEDISPCRIRHRDKWPTSKTACVLQPQWVNAADRIPTHIAIDVIPALQADGILGQPTPLTRIIVPHSEPDQTCIRIVKTSRITEGLIPRVRIPEQFAPLIVFKRLGNFAGSR